MLFYTGMRSGELFLEPKTPKAKRCISIPNFLYDDIHEYIVSMLIELGFTPLEIADRLGHESGKTTFDTYSHLYHDKDQKLADRLNQFRRTPAPEESTWNST